LLGSANWKIPGWLDRVLPHLNIEGSAGPPTIDEHEGAGQGEPQPVAG
jgi:RND superfamily putative drug exporter